MQKYDRPLKLTASETMDWLKREFPQAFAHGTTFHVEALEPGKATVRAELDENSLRPGGTVMGPAMMKLADFACYVLLIAHDGDEAAMSVTTNMSMSFVRKPEPGDIICEVMILKHGKTLIVMDAKIYSSRSGALIANGEMTYFNAVR